MRYLTLTFLLSFISILAYAQSTVSGTVKDASSGQPVPFVSIGIKGRAQGTVTNEQGNFSLNSPTLPVTLTISHLSYQPLEVTVANTNAINISLKPQTTQLPEVTVGNPALEIMRQVAAKAAKNVHTEYFPKVFFRRLTLEGDKPTLFAESFMDAQWQSWGLIKYNITNSRYLQANNGINYNNVAMVSLTASGYVNNSLVNSPVCHKPDSLYKYSIEKTFTLAGHEVAVIKCELKDADHTQHSAFVGEYYIDTQNFTVLKREGTITKFQMSTSGPLSLKLRDLHIISEYKLSPDSNTVLAYSNFTLRSTVKAGIVNLKQLTFIGQLYALDYTQNIDKAALADVTIDKLQKEEEKFKSVSYDPEYWKKNPVIKRTSDEDAAVTQLEQFKNVKGNLSKQ